LKKLCRQIIQIFLILNLILPVILPGLGKLYGQISPESASDSSHLSDPQHRYGYDFSNLQFSTKDYNKGSANFLEDFAGHRFQFAKNLSIQTGNYPGLLASSGGRNMQYRALTDSTGGNLNTGYFQRNSFRLQGLRLDIQNFSLGASYNYGLNNFWKSGGDLSQGAKNAGLSIHAGLRF
jgi:hypothetical protein